MLSVPLVCRLAECTASRVAAFLLGGLSALGLVTVLVVVWAVFPRDLESQALASPHSEAENAEPSVATTLVPTPAARKPEPPAATIPDQEGGAWVMLHSGSRYLGVTVRDYYVEQGPHLDGIDVKRYAKVPYLPASAPLAQDYLADLQMVLDFARESRREMLLRVLECLAEVFPESGTTAWQDAADQAYDMAHNFIGREQHFGQPLFVHRKGAIRVEQGRVGMIPGSMGTASYIVEGRGNAFGFCSGSHGAGRAMSRTEALRAISDNDFLRSVEDVVHEHDPRLKDEAPAAYKDIRRVMRSQKDLVKVLYELRPLLSVKGQ
jgi:tRNA-splicing ligase RtcB